MHALAGVRARASSRSALKNLFFPLHMPCCLFIFELSRQTSYHVYRSMRATRVRNSMIWIQEESSRCWRLVDAMLLLSFGMDSWSFPVVVDASLGLTLLCNRISFAILLVD